MTISDCPNQQMTSDIALQHRNNAEKSEDGLQQHGN
jgi:hypothetical protein